MNFTAETDLFHFRRGSMPLMVSVPHAGTQLPVDIASRMNDNGLACCDTDWFVDRLYDLPILGECSLIVSKISRYVVDLNRPPDGESLYPGQNTTGLCPLIQFDGTPLYRAGHEPDSTEIRRRVDAYWRPYHAQMSDELSRLCKNHSNVLLFDAHSIASRVPRLFEGQLPDFSFGTNRDATCTAATRDRLTQFVREDLLGYSHVFNGRFVGGFITRHYAQPDAGLETLQLELSQATYLDESRGEWNVRRAAKLQSVLSRLFETLLRDRQP